MASRKRTRTDLASPSTLIAEDSTSIAETTEGRGKRLGIVSGKATTSLRGHGIDDHGGMSVLWISRSRGCDPECKFITLKAEEVSGEHMDVGSLKKLLKQKMSHGSGETEGEVNGSGEYVMKYFELNGVCVRDEYKLENLIPLLRCHQPRWVVATFKKSKNVLVPSGGASIYVKDLLRRTLTVEVSSTMLNTIEEVKEKIKDLKAIPAEQQKLIFAGKQLENEKTLADYKVENGSTFHLILNLRGGSGLLFADVSNQDSLKKLEFSTDAPLWRLCHNGLNVEGECVNKDCKAFGKMVIDRNMDEYFNLLADKGRCPICLGRFTPLTCGFVSCMWKFEGVKSSDKLHLSSDWKPAIEEGYHRISHEVSNIVEWDSLLVMARPRFGENTCVICYEHTFGNKTKTECNHEFHTKCLQAWHSRCLQQNIHPSCPMCRRSLPLNLQETPGA